MLSRTCALWGNFYFTLLEAINLSPPKQKQIMSLAPNK
jgi:hypothetical protein